MNQRNNFELQETKLEYFLCILSECLFAVKAEREQMEIGNIPLLSVHKIASM